MSGQINSINLELRGDTFVSAYPQPNSTFPAGSTMFGTISLYENGPPLFPPITQPGPVFQSTIYHGFGIVTAPLTPGTSYWMRIWIEDALGNITSDSSEFVNTVGPGQFLAAGDAFNSCGTSFPPTEDRVVYNGGREPSVKGGETA